MCGCLLHTPTGDVAPNPGMCPDWELNQRPFSLQAGAQSTEPHQPGLHLLSNLAALPQLSHKELHAMRGTPHGTLVECKAHRKPSGYR